MRTSRSLRWSAGVVGVLAAALALVALAGRPQSRQGPGLEGPCSVEALVVETGKVIDPSAGSEIYEIPIGATIAYDASIDVPQPDGRRPLTGGVEVDLPWPLGRTRVSTFDGEGSRLEAQGSTTVDVPWAIAPIGATATVHARYDEADARCAGSLTVRLTGGFTDGLPRPLALGTTVLGALGCLLGARARWRPIRDANGIATGEHARVGRPGLGAFGGFFLGFGLALMALLWSVVPLESALLTLLPIVGLAGGTALGYDAPLGARSPTAPTRADELPELQLLE